MSIRSFINTSCIIALLFSSCNFIDKKDIGKKRQDALVVARVNDSYLYYKDLPSYIKGLSGKDSVIFANSFRENWIKDQLMADLAKGAVFEDDPEIAHKVENFRNSLLISEYQRRYVKNKLDTTISKKQIEDFYRANSSQLLNPELMVKGTYIKVPSNVPELKKIKELIGTSQPNSELISFSVRYAKEFQIDSWFPYSMIEKEPLFANSEQRVPLNTLQEKSDSEYSYLVYIKESRAAGQPAPLAYIEGEIKNLILNERKLKIIQKLEEEIYNEGKKTGQFEVY